MSANLNQLEQWITNIADLLAQNGDLELHDYISFLQEPEMSLRLIDLIEAMHDNEQDETNHYYSACIFALDICVAQLQVALENGHKLAGKLLENLMNYMAKTLIQSVHPLSFWLPMLNSFYEVHTELSPQLRDAYLQLAEQEDDLTPEEETNHLQAIRDMIVELSDLSVFDIAENFFAQSYAMPADFFSDLVVDLYSINEGQDVALLMLLHPKQEVREVVVATIEQLIDYVQLSSISLTRLQAIKDWYPRSYHDRFNRWIKHQRKKGVIFYHQEYNHSYQIQATEIDGTGAQGLFIHSKEKRKHRLCGLLLKQDVGVKDAWLSPIVAAKEVNRYYGEVFDESVTMRDVDKDYLLVLTNHFLAKTIQEGSMPDLYLLQIQEVLGLHFKPEPIDIAEMITALSVQISPFTEEALHRSFKRSKLWTSNKRFTESWYVENSHIDKLVNRYCTIVEGVKVCDIASAMAAVFKQELEKNRDRWLFHFLWIALWCKAHARKTEKIWQDSFFIAYSINQGMHLSDIPLMNEICRQTVINSVETMHERRTHLSKES